MKPTYLDCNATTPIDQEVLETVVHYLEEEFGNSGSRTHIYGQQANKAVSNARKQIADLVNCDSDEVLFTSGATESNNLVFFGLEEFARRTNKTHIISSQIEHKAVLEPLDKLSNNGFDVDLLEVDHSGKVNSKDLERAIREDTFLISIMHANNETGIIQPIDDIASIAKDKNILFHTDAAQTYGKEIAALENEDIDMISFSGHKIYGPKGIGGLILRRNKEMLINESKIKLDQLHNLKSSILDAAFRGEL